MQRRKRYAVSLDYEAYQRLVKIRSDLEHRLGFVVSLSEIVRLTLNQMDLEKTAKLILEQRKAGSDPTRKEPASDPLEVATA